MISIKEKEKSKMNVLKNIDNFTGGHSGRMAPVMIFIVLCIIPVMVWFMFMWLINFWVFLVFELLWCGRWALFILGKENKRLEIYRASKRNIYENANKLVHVTHQYDDGLVEYSNGTVMYCIAAEPKDFLEDDVFTYNMEQFLQQLNGYQFDIYGHNIVDEDRLENEFENLAVYSDRVVIADRIEVFNYGDEYCSAMSAGYRFLFVVKASKYNWKKLRAAVLKMVESDYATMFNSIYVCDRDQVSDVMSRDILTWIDLQSMLTKKYTNEQYYGSKVLFYGDDIPKEYRPEEEKSSLDDRRVVEEK